MSTASDVAALDKKINELGQKHEAMAAHVIKLTELLMSLVDAARLMAEAEDAAHGE